MSTTNRDMLLKLTTLVRPALSAQAYIPAYQHIKFADGFATAYNDVTAIIVKADVDIEACVPGELLIKALSSFNADQVMLQDGENGNLHLSSGRSKLKLPTLPAKDFPFALPRAGKAPSLSIDDGLLDGIRRCLFSVGADPTHPAQMGVTLEEEDGYAVLYSTDNHTISRAQTKSRVDLPGGSPIILPTFFCEQLLVLAKAYPNDDIDLALHAGALLATFGTSAKLLTKTMVDAQPLDFVRIISGYLKIDKVKAGLFAIPDAFDAAWNRAMLILSAEQDKATLVSISGKTIELLSKSAVGEAQDTLSCDGDVGLVKDFHVDPSLVLRGAKACGSLAFYPRTMVLASDDATFIHLIAHCSV